MTNWLRLHGADLLGVLGLLALGLLAYWQLGWLGTDLQTPISHGINEDWDWQLGLYEASRASLLRWHQVPGWNPWVQGGVPLLANPESPFLYPPFLLILLFGSSAGLKLWVLFHLVLLVVTAWWAGREQGLGPLTAHGAGLVMLCSAQLPAQTAMGHIMYLPLGWLPLAWLALRRGSWRWAGVCLAMPVLAGAHHVAVYALMLLLADTLLRGLDPRRLWVLGLWLLLNVLLLGQAWAFWPLVVLGVGALAWQRPRPEGSFGRALVVLGLALLLAGLLCGPKLATLPALWERAERLTAQVRLSIADDYTPWMALRVLLGRVDRPSAHNGQNVLFSPVPLVLAALGLVWAFRRQPVLTVVGLLFLDLGWGGATPVNLLQVVHRLPPWDHIRVVERYGAVWSLCLGWFAAWGVWGLGRWPAQAWLRWPLRALLLGAVGWYIAAAAPHAAWYYRIGPGRPHPIPGAGPFVQVDDDLTTWESMQANRGKPRCWTTAWLADPGPVKAREDEGYLGEVYLTDGMPVPALLSPNRIAFEAPKAGTLVVNQNAFSGWRYRGKPAGSRDGLLSVEVPAGEGVLVYSPPGLWLGVVLALAGLGLLCWPRRAAARAAGSSPTASALA